jgi:hypothetical protein
MFHYTPIDSFDSFHFFLHALSRSLLFQIDIGMFDVDFVPPDVDD